jgi:hypothetical protein
LHTSEESSHVKSSDARSFIARTTPDNHVDARIQGSNSQPDQVILIVNHGAWRRSDLGGPGIPAAGQTAIQTSPADPANADIAWQLFFFDATTNQFLGGINAPDNPCFRD